MPSYVVTGASRGLGYAFITNLAAVPGNTVIGLVRNKAGTEERLAKDGIKNVTIFQADITDQAALHIAAAETAKLTGGSLDYLIQNAGYISDVSSFSTLADFESQPEALAKDMQMSFDANVIGTVYTTTVFLPLIRKGYAKKIIAISTGMADSDLVNRFLIGVASPYSISKIALNMLVAKYNVAYKSEGILFLAVSPGLVDTSEGKPMTAEEIEGAKAMGTVFTEYAPDFRGPITPQTSVKMVLDVVEKATIETMGGAFVSHYGNKQWL